MHDETEQPQPRRGLLVDFGGVLTSDVFEAVRAFCTTEGLDSDAVLERLFEDGEAAELVADLECGRITDEAFELRFAALLEVADHKRLLDRILDELRPDSDMVDAVRRIRAAGVRTGLISNSWGVGFYDRSLFGELFDGTVISGEVGVRKPDPDIYALGAQAIGLAPPDCVFVDDFPGNLEPARELGMATVHHVSLERTVPELERLLGVRLR